MNTHSRAQRPPHPLVVYWRKVGGGSFTLSVLIHAGLIALAVAWVTAHKTDQEVDFLSGGRNPGAEAATHEVATQIKHKEQSKLATSLHRITVTDGPGLKILDHPFDPDDLREIRDTLINLPQSVNGVDDGPMSLAGFGPGVGKDWGIGHLPGFNSFPLHLKARCGSDERLTKLAQNGGSPQCERAVSTALEYFKTKQNPDGSWGTKSRGAMTGFVLLCYLGRCETPDSHFYGENVMKGILYLTELSKKNDGFMADNLSSNGSVYEHGIATYALGEMYSLARMGDKQLSGMREAFERGVQLIIQNQLPNGGWGYKQNGGYRSTGNGDPSVTGWQFQALKAAKYANLKVAGLHSAIERTTKYLESIQTKEGGFGGTNREAGAYTEWTMTPVGVLGLQTLATGKSDRVRKGIHWASTFHHEEPPTWQNANLYSWYYYAQAYFQYGGAEWKYWNENALPAILSNQDKSGAWRSKGDVGGANIYETALCTLMLEVYYRYLRVGDREQGSIFDRSSM